MSEQKANSDAAEITVPMRKYITFANDSDGAHQLYVATFNCLAPRYSTAEAFPKINPAYLRFSHRFPLLMQEIKQANADILCLQEVDEDVISMIAAELGRTFVNISFDCNVGDSDPLKLAIFWRKYQFSMIKAQALMLDEESSKRVRGMHVRLVLPGNGKRFDVVNLHLKSKPENDEVRAQELATMKKILFEQNIFNNNTALILAGDFNSVPTSKSIGSLFNWAYSFKEAHTGTDDDCTLPDVPPTSAKFRNDTKYCLVSDYLFYCGKVRALAYLRRFDARDKSDYLLPTEDYGSDHLLTAAKFELY